MAQPNFDYEGALNAGYSQDEIKEFIQKSKSATRSPEENLIANNQSIKSPSTKEVGESFKKIANFDYEGALASGYNKDEINQFLESQKPKRSALEQAGKIAGQLGMGAVESALLPYEIAVAPLSIPGGQEALGDLFTREILSEVYPTEEEGKFVGQRELKEPIDLGVRSLTEKATGLDLKPEGVLEKAANWMGFIKNPKNWPNLAKSGITPKNLAKAIAPTGTEAMRGVGAGVALEMAEDGQYGPIGTMGAAIVGDMAGGGIGAIFKAGKRILTNPKESLAKFAAKMTKPEVKAGEILSKPEKLQLQKDVIKDFRDAGIQADLGTITNNNFIKMTQARLSQSGLSGNALREFKDTITKDIKQEYKALADSLGEARVISNHEAGLIAKEGMKSIREADLAATRQLYENANKSLRENSFVESKKLAESIAKLEKELKPGSIKSAEQSAVLNTLDKVKKDLYTPQGKLKLANVKDLMNNKIALNDIINYEVQGGAKQLLKGIVGELDRAIISHGKENIPFVRNYITANKRFAQHAKMFRSKTAKNIMNAEDPSQLINKMNSVQGLKEISGILSKTPEGTKILNDLKRFKLDKIVGDGLVDSTTQQVKYGTFSKLLEKGKNKEIVRELLGSQGFKRLERLQRNSGRLAESANKFLNASQSGVVAADAAIIGKLLADLGHILTLNPWPLIKTTSGLIGARKLNKLLSDPDFLKSVEDVILASEKGSPTHLQAAIKNIMAIIDREGLRAYLLEGLKQSKND